VKDSALFQKAIVAFDNYNSKDPNRELIGEDSIAKEVLYAQRMSSKLLEVKLDAPEYLRLAAHSQHIGRWEIARSSYPMNRNGYLKWRSQLKIHHAKIAGEILLNCGYDSMTIDKVKSLLLKRELNTNPDSQLLEDIVCLVFIEYYLDDFAAKHEEDKVIDIIQKTMKKMSAEAIEKAGSLSIDKNILSLLSKAASRL
jgi:hypothetical protein